MVHNAMGWVEVDGSVQIRCSPTLLALRCGKGYHIFGKKRVTQHSNGSYCDMA